MLSGSGPEPIGPAADPATVRPGVILASLLGFVKFFAILKEMSKTVLITGGSGGIGLALAEVFASHGHDLFLVARNAEELQKAKAGLEQRYKISVITLAKDLIQAGSAKEVFEFTKAQNLDVQYLVNNAGFGLYGKFADHKIENELDILRLNNLVLTELTGLFLQPMIIAKHGYILNLGSTAAFQPGPLMAVYYASKAYVLSFSEALRNELKNSGVHVTCLCPGPTKSQFFAKMPEMAQTRLIKASGTMNTKIVAQAGYRGLMRHKAVVIPGFLNSFLAFGNRLVPRSLATFISRQTLNRSTK